MTKTIRSSFDSRERDSYDDAIEDYKNRVSKAVKLDLPKVDINKRRELFEKEPRDDASSVSPSAPDSKLGSEIVSIKDRISSLRSNLAASTVSAPAKKLELPTTTKLKDRLSSLQQLASPVDEIKKNPLDVQFKNVQEARNEIELKQQTVTSHSNGKLSANDDNESLESTDREDSGVQTTDVSCAVSQADDQLDQHLDEFQQVAQDKIASLTVNDVISPSDSKAAIEEPDVENETSVSCLDDNQTQSVLVLTNKFAQNDPKPTNKAMLDFIRSDMQQLDDVLMDNNYVYECIINRSEHQTGHGLEKSNSIDTALSLCSSSDGHSLVEDADDKNFR